MASSLDDDEFFESFLNTYSSLPPPPLTRNRGSNVSVVDLENSSRGQPINSPDVLILQAAMVSNLELALEHLFLSLGTC